MKVSYLPMQPICFAYGGFEIQLQSTFDAILSAGGNVSKLDIWDRKADFDILHCWGLGLSHIDSYQWAKKAKKKVVATILLEDKVTIRDQIRFRMSSYIGAQRILIDILKYVDSLILVNENQASLCADLYQFPRNKISIIPNVINSEFYTSNGIKSGDYFLIAGNICPRKNQLSLAKACVQAGYKLVIIGKVLEGHEIYASELEVLVRNHPNLMWIPGLKENSDDLLKYYRECKAVVLPSFSEQQPISLLEGGALGKPLVIGDRPYARQIYYEKSCKVEPSSVESITVGLREVIANPERYTSNRNVFEACRAAEVAKKYIKLYDDV